MSIVSTGDSSNGSPPPKGVIVGVVIAFLLLALIVAFYTRMKRKSKTLSPCSSNQDQVTPNSWSLPVRTNRVPTDEEIGLPSYNQHHSDAPIPVTPPTFDLTTAIRTSSGSASVSQEPNSNSNLNPNTTPNSEPPNTLLSRMRKTQALMNELDRLVLATPPQGYVEDSEEWRKITELRREIASLMDTDSTNSTTPMSTSASLTPNSITGDRAQQSLSFPVPSTVDGLATLEETPSLGRPISSDPPRAPDSSINVHPGDGRDLASMGPPPPYSGPASNAAVT